MTNVTQLDVAGQLSNRCEMFVTNGSTPLKMHTLKITAFFCY